MAQTIELPDVLASAIDVALRGVWTAMPGRVESYSASTQCANIQLGVQSGSIGESGTRQVETIAVLNSVPVVHLGGGGYRTVYPVTTGDTALVVFTSRSLAQWLLHGGLVDPGTDHHHALSDAVALVGLRDLKHSLTSAPIDRMSVGKDGGPTVEITATEVRLGGNAGTEPTLKATSFLQALHVLLGAIATQVGASGTPAGATAAGLAITSAIETFDLAVAGFTSTIAKVV